MYDDTKARSSRAVALQMTSTMATITTVSTGHHGKDDYLDVKRNEEQKRAVEDRLPTGLPCKRLPSPLILIPQYETLAPLIQRTFFVKYFKDRYRNG